MIEQINNRRRLKMGGDDFEKKWQEIEIAAKKGEKIEQEKMEILNNSLAYKYCTKISFWMDSCFLDPIIGLFPGVGDITPGLICTLPFIYVALIKLHSIPLTISIIFNSLIDMLIGLPPFIDLILDYLHKSNKKNLELLNGFINDDEEIKKKVYDDTIKCGIGIGIFIFILYHVYIYIKLLGEYIFTQIQNLFYPISNILFSN